jgi:hypothetical protein
MRGLHATEPAEWADASGREPPLVRCDPPGENLGVTLGRTASVWERRAWAAGIVFVVALLAETVI